MTELQCFLTYLLNLPGFPGKTNMIRRFSRHLRTIIDHSDWASAEAFLTAMTELDDAVVVGLNTKRFVFTHSSMSRYPQSVLPKFLYGLISQVFDDQGNLLINYSADSVEAILTGLRLVRRAELPGRQAVTHLKAIQEFVRPQESQKAPLNPKAENHLKRFWTWLCRDFDDNITLGFPGNGVTSNMRFPYVPRLSFPDINTLPERIRGIMHNAVLRALPESFEVTSDCEFIKLYAYVPFEERKSSISVVPKSFKTGRAITVTDTCSVIIGATFRETVWRCAERRGVKAMMNVHDQSRSIRIMSDHPGSTVRLDLEGGSTTIELEQQRQRLSGVPSALALFNHSVPFLIELPDGTIVPLLTLTMGDASCVANLTASLFGIISLADIYERFGDNVDVQPWHFDNSARFLLKEDCTSVVGDDMQFHKRLYTRVRALLGKTGTKVNVRKSSMAFDNHLETCGGWCLWDPQSQEYRKIFPFRAPKLSKDLVSDLSTLERAYARSKGSKFAFTVLLSYVTFLTHSLEYLNHESYRSDHIGSIFGIQPVQRGVRLRPRKTRRVPDDVAYAFNIAEGLVSPREQRRPNVDRGRIGKYRDFSFENATFTPSIRQISDYACKAEALYPVNLSSIFAFSIGFYASLTQQGTQFVKLRA